MVMVQPMDRINDNKELEEIEDERQGIVKNRKRIRYRKIAFLHTL